MKEQSDLSPEELERLEGEIPEWKRGAVVMTEEAPSEEKPGLFRRAKSRLFSKVSDTKLAKSFKESEEYKKIEEMRREM